MLDLNQTLVFAMAVRHGSFSGAARALGLPRSTVSSRISALEAHLGVRLFRRTTRRVALTDEGRAYHASIADAIDTLMAAGAGDRRGGLSGSIRLTAPIEYPQTILSRAITAFHQRHPRVRFEIMLTNRRVDFVADNVDLAIRGGDPGSPGLVATRLGDIAFGLYASPDYLEARGTPRQLADLAEHDLLPFVAREGRRLLGLPLPRVRASTAWIGSDSMTFLKRLAAQGAGIAVLPRHLCAASLRRGSLVHLVPEWRGAEISAAFLVFPSQRDISPRVRAFARQLKETVARRSV